MLHLPQPLLFEHAAIWVSAVSGVVAAKGKRVDLFSMIGTRKGLSLAFSAPVSVLLGVVTGVAGVILRDVLISEVPLVFQPETHLYATAAMCGASLCVAMVGAGAPLSLATLVGALVVLALRLAGIYWKISLPLLKNQ